MKRFFDNMDALNRYTLELRLHNDHATCPHCRQSAHLVSHGFVYKFQTHQHIQAIGKRILCSNRFGHTGCGRTQQLYVSTIMPSHHYSILHLCVFVLALLKDAAISTAYTLATQCQEPRHGYRWIAKMVRQTITFRQYLGTFSQHPMPRFQSASPRLRLLLPLLSRFNQQFPHPFIQAFQQRFQQAFI